jgi:crossover junction endodeoxyribonuclease RuvC
LVILGIDPSLNATGWAVINIVNRSAKLVASGVIMPTCKTDDYLRKIQNISGQIKAVIELHCPSAVAIEQTVVNTNALSSLKLGMVRGACVAMCYLKDILPVEYAPTTVKLSIVGSGGAKKDQVAFLVKQILSLGNSYQFAFEDESDAAAIALTYCLHHRLI